MSKKPLLAPGGVLNRRYRVDALLARGGFGEVYEAFDLRMERRVALKYIFQPLDLELLHNEVRILAAHAERLRFMPNVYDFWQGERGAGYFIVMEFVEGPTLDERVPPAWPATEVAGFLRVLLGNLRDLHGSRIVHCDIKPVNIKAAPGSTLSVQIPFRLLDFGIAQRDERTAVAAASPHYAAPEQHGLGAADVDHRADLYALGATAYFLLTGQRPLDARERYASIAHSGRDGLVQPTALAPAAQAGLAASILELMQLDRERRPRDAGAALAALERRLAPEPEPAPPPPPPPPRVELETQQVVLPPPLLPDTRAVPLPPLAPLPLGQSLVPRVAPTGREAVSGSPGTPPPARMPAAARLESRQAALLDRRGEGLVTGLAWEPSGEALLIATTLGVSRHVIGQPGCTPWLPTEAPVRALGITGGAELLVATDAGTCLVPLDRVEDGAPAPIQAGPAQLLTAAQSDIVALAEPGLLRLARLGEPAAARSWSLPPQLSGRVVALAGDGRTALFGTAGQLSTVLVPGLGRGRPASVGELPHPLTDAALTPDGAVAVAAGGDAVVVWATADAAAQVFPHPGAARVAVTSDGELLAVADEATVCLLRARDGLRLPALEETGLPGASWVTLCPHDLLLAAATPNEVRIWRLSDGALLARLDSFGHAGAWLAPDGETALVSLGDGLQRWELNGDRLVPGPAHNAQQPVGGLASGGGWLAGVEAGAVLLRRSGEEGRVVHRLTLAPAQQHGLAVDSSGTRLLTIGEDSVMSYELASGAVVGQAALAHGGGVEHVALAADGATLAVHRKGQINVRSAVNGAEICVVRPLASGEVTALGLAPDGSLLAVAQAGALLLYRLRMGIARLLGQHIIDNLPVHHLAFSADARALIALQGCEASVWHLGDRGIDGMGVRCLHGAPVTDALLVGGRLVTAAADGALRLWNLSA